MRILVTGGAGYIGSHTCKALAIAGHEPVVYDNLSTGHREFVKWGPLVKADLLDGRQLRRALREYRIEAIVHFAASAYVAESMMNPGPYFRNNCIASLELLEAMLECEVLHIVASSSCATFGIAEKIPISSSHPQRPVNPYGESKLFVEHALHWYEVAHNVRSVALRYFNAAGGDPDVEVGELHAPECHLIPLTLQASAEPDCRLSLFGTDYPTPDGTAVRDYVHVTDLADAHVDALEYLASDSPSAAVNLGTGQGHSIREVISMAEQVTGRRIKVREMDRRPGDPPVLIAEPDTSEVLRRWKPVRSSLDQIMHTAWAWYQKAAARTATPA